MASFKKELTRYLDKQGEKQDDWETISRRVSRGESFLNTPYHIDQPANPPSRVFRWITAAAAVLFLAIGATTAAVLLARGNLPPIGSAGSSEAISTDPWGTGDRESTQVTEVLTGDGTVPTNEHGGPDGDAPTTGSPAGTPEIGVATSAVGETEAEYTPSSGAKTTTKKMTQVTKATTRRATTTMATTSSRTSFTTTVTSTGFEFWFDGYDPEENILHVTFHNDTDRYICFGNPGMGHELFRRDGEEWTRCEDVKRVSYPDILCFYPPHEDLSCAIDLSIYFPDGLEPGEYRSEFKLWLTESGTSVLEGSERLFPAVEFTVEG